MHVKTVFVEDGRYVVVFFEEVTLELSPEVFLAEKVGAFYAATRYLVLVRGAYAAARGADFILAAKPFFRDVEFFVIRHYDVRVLAYEKVFVTEGVSFGKFFYLG